MSLEFQVQWIWWHSSDCFQASFSRTFSCPVQNFPEMCVHHSEFPCWKFASVHAHPEESFGLVSALQLSPNQPSPDQNLQSADQQGTRWLPWISTYSVWHAIWLPSFAINRWSPLDLIFTLGSREMMFRITWKCPTTSSKRTTQCLFLAWRSAATCLGNRTSNQFVRKQPSELAVSIVQVAIFHPRAFLIFISQLIVH